MIHRGSPATARGLTFAGPLLVGLVLAACSGIPLPTDMERAQGLERAGDDGAALAAWRAIREACDAKGPRPHDDCGLAATREAQLLERAGRDAEAAAAWEGVVQRSQDDRTRARALARAAALHVEKLADPAGGERLAWRAVTELPDEEPTDDALALAVRLARARDARALRDRLDALARRLPAKADLVDNLLFDAADLSEKELADAPGAVARFDELARRFPHSSLFDDALWRAAALLRRSGDPRGALERLARLLRTRRDALIVGSYNSVYLDDAQLLVGQIERDDLHDRARAEDAFRLLVDDYPESTLRDDGLYELARTHLGDAPERASDADRTAACRALTRLLHDFPDGNRARAARDLAATARCP